MGLPDLMKKQDKCRNLEAIANDFGVISSLFYPEQVFRNVNGVAGRSTSLTALAANGVISLGILTGITSF
jgi:hypothetical protein